jgi:HAD superfamily hydrolase (TIGR01509 family)
MDGPNMTQAIFWDNDGILVDTERLYFEATRQILGGVGVELSQADYVELFMVQSAGPWELVRAAGVSNAGIEQLRNDRDALYSEWLTSAPLVLPGVQAILESLRGKYVMGVVTSAYRQHFDLIHQRSGLLPYFDFVLTGEDCTAVKPDPAPYLQAIARSGIAAPHCLAIEDTERGLRAAKAAGLRCAVLPNRLISRGNFDAADAILSELADIRGLL